MVLFSTVTNRVVKLLRQVAGQSVQTYSQPLVEDFVNQAFRFTFKKNFWPVYTREGTYILDEATGVITSNLRQTADEVIEFDDIQSITPVDAYRPLPLKPVHLASSVVTGTRPMYIAPLNVDSTHLATRVFKVLPPTAEGSVIVVNRFRPKSTFTSNDEIHLDEDMLVYAATYLYLKDDGSVPDMVDNYKELFDVRYRDMTKGIHNQPIQLRKRDVYGMRHGSLTDWR